MEHHRRVDVAGTGTHDQAFQGSQPHRGVHRQPTEFRAGGRTISQMQGDLFHGVVAQVVADLVGYEFMGSAVGAVATDVVVMRHLFV